MIALALSLTLAASPIPARPGPEGAGVTRLPSGWRIAPAGKHLAMGDLPLAVAVHPGGRWAAVVNAGFSRPSVRIVDLELRQVVSEHGLEHAWDGLLWDRAGEKLYVTAAGANAVEELAFAKGALTPSRRLALSGDAKDGFAGGLAFSPDGATLYVAQVHGEGVEAVDLATAKPVARAALPAEGYGVVAAADAVYASVWGAAKVVALAPRTLEPLWELEVGEHPSALALSPDGQRLFVACASTNEVWAVDLAARRVDERLGVALSPRAPPGTTPAGLALSADGGTLLVANADANAVAVLDVSRPGQGRARGFVPSGWYPTAVAFDDAHRRWLVVSGKGLSSVPNPRGPQPVASGEGAQYVAALLKGALSLVPTPDDAALAAMTRKVVSLSAWSASAEARPPGRPKGSPIPAKVGGRSPIEHVVYVIRENRTYDQVLGDLERGDGDPNLTIFGEDVTPNGHALARAFVTFDRFFVNAEVSAGGHAYSTAAYATDATEKLWPTFYAGRGGKYLTEHEHGTKLRTPYGNLSAPPRGYLWDLAGRAGVSVRSYGEFAHKDPSTGEMVAAVPGLAGKVHPSYPSWDLNVPDGKRVELFLEELRRFEQDGGFPRLSIVRLPNDHTTGTAPGMPTPRAMVAENDLALGKLVEGLSRSRFWPKTAVLVVEDDAQDGPDHVDAHRSVLLVASPWARRGALDSTMYSTASVLRTIELVLGLPPMSAYDAAAPPLFGAFQAAPDVRPFNAVPARMDLEERNGPDAPGAKASLELDFREADRIPGRTLADILWRSVKGDASTAPPPVRAGFVWAVREAADDDD
ncbi:MAG: bifunctional YncE family protein/alkaline phosphatase family protein [Anaeromyxobacter sp.]